MSKAIYLFKEEIETEIDKIWLKEPEDIYALKKGYLPSGAGIYDQYFSVLVMLGGEMRALGIHIFADLLDLAEHEEFHLSHLKIMVKRMLKIDCGVIGYFGLPVYGSLLNKYYISIDDVETKEEFLEVTQLMFTLTNRYQLWMHQIFPWGVSVYFKQRNPEDYKEVYNKLINK
ncbi:hypothetical protein [Evansella clarkii]|uniref:cucumopine synthase-related protein n=1 Tax=Evansella clarkii TaxID=79879 RepID=UPI00099644A7|nr:hypothetical protein [Evansella clarkii]